MYKRMLVPLDGSHLAEDVFVYARELALRMNLELISLHVCNPNEQELLPVYQAYVDRTCETLTCQAAELQEEKGLQQCQPVKAKCELATGYPAEEIIKYAEENSVDFILMATHGRSGLKRWALGSVADKVLRASSVPVWLIRPGVPEDTLYDKWPSETMLVPLDGSKFGEAVLPHVEALATQQTEKVVDVVLMQVVERPFVTADYTQAIGGLTWEEHVKDIESKFMAKGKQYLQEIESRLEDAGVRNVQSRVLMGKPAEEIVDYANNNPFSIIVMATHGHSGITRWAYGNTADKVLHGVTTPIFLVRPH